MKKILTYRKLFGTDKSATLKDLKTIYRNFMKEWHPDKFANDPEGLANAEHKSKEIIEAYHFLVSIAPETHALQLEAYTNTMNNATIADYQYKGTMLEIEFSDGSKYEYFEVPKPIYVKLVNSDKPARFARRHICTSYLYRNVSASETVE